MTVIRSFDELVVMTYVMEVSYDVSCVAWRPCAGASRTELSSYLLLAVLFVGVGCGCGVVVWIWMGGTSRGLTRGSSGGVKVGDLGEQ